MFRSHRPFRERPTLEVNQEFRFDAAARAVFDYFMRGAKNGSRVIQGREGDMYFIAELIETPSPCGAYYIDVLIHSGDKRWADPGKYRGTMARYHIRVGGAAIGIVALGPDSSRTTLYTDSFDGRWLPLDSSPTPDYLGAREFVAHWWRKMIEEWRTPRLSKDTGGRPRNPEDVWAYEQVHREHRDSNEVYIEWLKRIGPRAHVLMDPRDSYKKAIRKRPRKASGEERD
jgi:hypothetical protein